MRRRHLVVIQVDGHSYADAASYSLYIEMRLDSYSNYVYGDDCMWRRHLVVIQVDGHSYADATFSHCI